MFLGQRVVYPFRLCRNVQTVLLLKTFNSTIALARTWLKQNESNMFFIASKLREQTAKYLDSGRESVVLRGMFAKLHFLAVQ